MTGAAGDTDAVRPNERVVAVVVRVADEACAVPLLAGFIVKLWIGKEAEPEDAGWLAVNFVVDAGWLWFNLLVEPEAVFIRLGRGAETGFVDQTERLEALAARILAVVEHLEQIHQPEAVLGDMIPEMLVAAAPEIPSVAAHNLVRRELDAAIHRLEDVGRDLREIVRREPGKFGFVFGRRFAAARGEEKKEGQGARSERREAESRRPTACQHARSHG